MIKVGSIKEYREKLNNKTKKMMKVEVLYSYKDVKSVSGGWIDSSLYLPEDYDLVNMKLERDKTIVGWVSGKSWNGLRLKPNDRVCYWKRKIDEEICH